MLVLNQELQNVVAIKTARLAEDRFFAAVVLTVLRGELAATAAPTGERARGFFDVVF